MRTGAIAFQKTLDQLLIVRPDGATALHATETFLDFLFFGTALHSNSFLHPLPTMNLCVKCEA